MKSLETRVRELESLLEGRDIDLHERMTTLEETLGIHLHNQSQLDRRIRMIECRVASLEVAKLSGPAPGEPRTERNTTPTCGSTDGRGDAPLEGVRDDISRTESAERIVKVPGGPAVVIGRPCPTCGLKVRKRAFTNAERQRNYLLCGL